MASQPGDGPWKRKRPEGAKKTTLSAGSRARARQRARAAGRKYPNLVDNMWAAAQQRAGAKSGKKTAGKKKAGKKKA